MSRPGQRFASASHRKLNPLPPPSVTCSTRSRLKQVFRQYELRERQYEAVLRSKELEILLARARSEECVSLLSLLHVGESLDHGDES